MHADQELLDAIRARVGAGRLPSDGEVQIFGGKGDGAVCACCDLPITRTQIQYDIELRSVDGTMTVMSMHLDCFEAWQRISQRK